MNTARRAGGRRRQRTIIRRSPGSIVESCGPSRRDTSLTWQANRSTLRGRPPCAPFRRAAALLAALLLRPPLRPICLASTGGHHNPSAWVDPEPLRLPPVYRRSMRSSTLCPEGGETMHRSMIVLTVAMAAGLAAEARAEDLNPKQFAQRTELYSIPSLTISDEQFLKGDANGKPVTVNGEFRIAQGAGRLPVVVLVHGSGGYGANVELWVRELNPMGISTFVVDGFTGRGLTQVNTNQALLGRLNLILDVYRALDILAKHPRVDPQRVALMGFSRGGQATLFASLKRFNALWNKSGVELAAHIPFYPDCMTSYIDDTKLTPHPVRLFGGTPDDYNPIARCKAYAERLKAA